MYKILSQWMARYLSDPEAVGLLACLIAAILILMTMGKVFAPLIAGIVIAYMLSGMVKKLQRIKFPHLLAVCLVYLIFLTLFFFIFIWLLPLLWEELNTLFAEIPKMVAQAQILLTKFSERYPEYFTPAQIRQFTSQATGYIANYGREFLSFSLSSILSLATVVVYLVLVPLLVFFFLRDATPILQWTKRFLPAKRDAMNSIWSEVHVQIGSYIKGKVLEMLIVAIVTIIAFALLGLNYAVLLGALVGLSVLIPYIGIVIVTIPIVIVALIQWGWGDHFFYLLIVYAVISILDANVLVPLLFAEAMNLHPIAIIFSVLLFGSLGGFWGVFFAIPLMTFFNALLNSWPKVES